MRTWMIIGLGLTLLLGIGAVLWAAEGGAVTCANKECGFQQDVTIGPTMVTDAVGGYCTACQKFVEIRWVVPRKEIMLPAEEPPKPLGTVWNAETGKTATLYACPTCHGPFQAIDNMATMKYCPKCGKQTLSFTLDRFED